MIIYKYTNIHNGKPYIGQTSTTVEERARDEYFTGYHKCKKFYNAIKFYTADGSKVLDHFVLEKIRRVEKY